MAHNPHPHGERVVQPHQLKDHLFEKASHPVKLPDSKREDHMAQPYPNEFNPEPGTEKKVE
jgi:hypothetical protein